MLSPELVLVSGEGTQAWAHLADEFDAALRETVFGPLSDVRVEVDPWDDAKWAVGAATLVLRASFAAPFEHKPPRRQEVVA
jgi:predicted NBD/HSP70 family sugar kinase